MLLWTYDSMTRELDRLRKEAADNTEYGRWLYNYQADCVERLRKEIYG